MFQPFWREMVKVSAVMEDGLIKKQDKNKQIITRSR
jgi:hypothetical protein